MLLLCKKNSVSLVLLAAVFVFCSWKGKWRNKSGYSQSAEEYLNHFFDPDANAVKLKKWDLKITDAGFFRYRKYLINGKQEYFSFKLNKLHDMDYLGTEEHGYLIIKTNGDDVIVQTYNDASGDIDSMGSLIMLPVKNISVESLNDLQKDLLALKKN